MVRDFAPVAHVASAPNLLVVTNSLPVKNVAELIAYLKANPDKLSFGSPGIGTPVHVAGELFKSLTGTQMQLVQSRALAAEKARILTAVHTGRWGWSRGRPRPKNWRVTRPEQSSSGPRW